MASTELGAPIVVNSPDVIYTPDEIRSRYVYHTTAVAREDGQIKATPQQTVYDFRTARVVPKTGLMLVGWGGNNGSTLTAGILANKLGLSWDTREGKRSANYHGSVVMGSTIKLGTDESGTEVYVPFRDLLPMVHPNDLAIGGWDISAVNMADAMDRAGVLEPTLKSQLREHMAALKPLPSIYYPDFIASNQSSRADNVIAGSTASWDHVERVRADIRSFKAANKLDRVVIVWTANTERYADLVPGVNDTADNLLAAIRSGHAEVAPSTIFAVASILEGVPFVNGSPQNTFVPGAVQLAEREGAFIGGDDFKSGQTKLKSSLVDFLINAGIRLTSIASYNHLGNNDGRNLSSQKQFRSKEISKSNVVDDMVAANSVLYQPDEHPDHCVVIKYMPAVGDNKRALDEYYAEIFMGGHQTISVFNVCEDSLLAAPLIVDLAVLAELFTRITWRQIGKPVVSQAVGEGHVSDAAPDFQSFHPVLSVLSYMLKAPITPPGTPVVNALGKQRAAVTNILRACIGLQPESDMTLEHKLR